jgi:hypothetical protein
MMRINDREVELNEVEIEARDDFDDLLDRGFCTPDAVSHVRSIYGDQLTDEFYRYISE